MSERNVPQKLVCRSVGNRRRRTKILEHGPRGTGARPEKPVQPYQPWDEGIGVHGVDGLQLRFVPRVDIAEGQDDLGIRIRAKQLFGQDNGRDIGHSLAPRAVAQRPVELLSSVRLTCTVVFGLQCFHSHGAIPRVL